MNEIVKLVEREKPTLRALLQDHPALTVDRLINIFFSAQNSSHALAQCTPESLIQALLQAAAVGVEVNTPLQHAALIPRKGKDGRLRAQFQLMYRGRMYLAIASGAVIDWVAEAVYRQDHFLWRPASSDPIDHIPELDHAKGPDDLRGAYSLITLPTGVRRARWMPRADIERIRDQSSESWRAYVADRSKNDTPWLRYPAEMYIKTVVNHHFKLIPLVSPKPVSIDGREWLRGAAVAAQVPDVDEAASADDGELAEDERPRPASESQSPRQQPVPKRQQQQSALKLTPDDSPDEELAAKTGGDDGEEAGRTLNAEEAALVDAQVERSGLKPKQLMALMREFNIADFSELRIGQLDEFAKKLRAAK